MAREQNITFTQGDRYTASMVLWGQDVETPYDYTDVVARMQIRRNPKAPVLLELSTDNAGLVFETDEDDNNKTWLIIYISAEESAELPADIDLGYDLELVRGDDVRTIMAGTLTLTPEYTRDA